MLIAFRIKKSHVRLMEEMVQELSIRPSLIASSIIHHALETMPANGMSEDLKKHIEQERTSRAGKKEAYKGYILANTLRRIRNIVGVDMLLHNRPDMKKVSKLVDVGIEEMSAYGIEEKDKKALLRMKRPRHVMALVSGVRYARKRLPMKKEEK